MGAAAGGGVQGPVLKYPGGKWTVADWLVRHLPAHEVYVEPYFGSGALFFSKHPSRLETINDLDERVVNLWRVLRHRPDELAYAVACTPWARAELRDVAGDVDEGDEVERARRFLVWCWQQIGRRTGGQGVNGWRWTKDAGSRPLPQWRRLPERITAAAERLRAAQIECLPALEVIRRNRQDDVLLYCDPPYMGETLGDHARVLYRHGMTTDQHAALLDALDAHPGPVLLSGYACALYDERLGHWRRATTRGSAEGGAARVETLWLNRVAVAALGRERQAALDFDLAAGG
jgi:DNA adenine methylase